MAKILACVLAIGFAGTTMLFQGTRTHRGVQNVDVEMANDGAYRDGLYLGKLNHDAKQSMLPPVGRWSTAKDRASFEQGYRQGFGDKETK